MILQSAIDVSQRKPKGIEHVHYDKLGVADTPVRETLDAVGNGEPFQPRAATGRAQSPRRE